MPSINVPALFQNGRAAGEEIVLSRERRRRRRRRGREEESPRKQRGGGGGGVGASRPHRRRSVGLQQSEDALEAAAADATAPPAATEERGIVVLVEAPSDAEAFVPSGKREKEREGKNKLHNLFAEQGDPTEFDPETKPTLKMLIPEGYIVCNPRSLREYLAFVKVTFLGCECDQILLMNEPHTRRSGKQ